VCGALVIELLDTSAKNRFDDRDTPRFKIFAHLHLIEPGVAGNAAYESRDQNPIATRPFRQMYHGVSITQRKAEPVSFDSMRLPRSSGI
jgi:hypothetical protein